MAIYDDYPADTDPRALAVAAIVARAREMGVEVVPLVSVQARRCGCGLGEVHRANDVTALIGIVVYRVATGTVKGRLCYEEHHQRYAVPLDGSESMVQFGCKHGGGATGELVGDTLARVRAEVASATRRGVRLRL